MDRPDMESAGRWLRDVEVRPVRGVEERRRWRSCAVLDIGGPEWDGYGDLHGRRQALRIERERRLVKQGAGSRETAYGLTSLGAGQAGPEELAALVRRHWHIENRLHYVRDSPTTRTAAGCAWAICRATWPA